MTENIRFPLPLNVHIGFVIVSIILLILCYISRKRNYELLMIIGIASTLLVYLTNTKPLFYILGLEELVVLVLIIIDMIRISRAESAAEKASAAAKSADALYVDAQKPENHPAEAAKDGEITSDDGNPDE